MQLTTDIWIKQLVLFEVRYPRYKSCFRTSYTHLDATEWKICLYVKSIAIDDNIRKMFLLTLFMRVTIVNNTPAVVLEQVTYWGRDKNIICYTS